MNTNILVTDEGFCLLGEHCLHPPSRPLQAAREELASVLSQAGCGDTLIIAGAGLGWHALAASQHPGGPQVVVYEPDAGRREVLAARGPSLEGVELVTNTEDLAGILAERLVYGDSSRVAVFAPPAFKEAEPELVDSVLEVVERVVNRSRRDKATTQIHWGTWLQNLSQNFARILGVSDLTLLANSLVDVPAIVVGAGPSLDQSLEALQGVGRYALTLGAASAMGPLERVDETLHVTVALEGQDETRQMNANPRGHRLLAAATSGHPAHFTSWQGHLGLFHLQDWAAGLAGQGMSLPTGGHATSAAFSLAVLWGCNPIILVGQDLAYSGGRSYAKGRPGAGDEVLDPQIAVPAISGGEVTTSRVMQSYISWYVEAAAWLKKSHPDRRIINATARGALLPGFEHLPLGRISEKARALDFDFNELGRLSDQLPKPALESTASRLSQARTQVRGQMAVVEAQGTAAAARAASEATPEKAALAGLQSSDPPEKAIARLEAMSKALRTMEEGLYAY